MSALTVGLVMVMCLLHFSHCEGVLFPFGHGVGDTFLERLDDGHAGPITLSTTFTFFDIPYDALFINIDGAISFQSKIRVFEPIRFPLTNDVIIAPFWADVNTDPFMGAGDVMFREEFPTNENTAVFSRANGIIRDMFIEQELFQASWLLVATWDNVTFYDVESPLTGPKNTFQCVLVTDGDFSGVIFIYDTIRWTGGGSGANGGGNGYSTATGLGGIAAEAGFNAGDGKNYYIIPGSGTADIVDIDLGSNTGERGTWVYQVDGAVIRDTTCGRTDFLSIHPLAIPMLGGTSVLLAGPCLNASRHDIKCKFDGVVVDGVVLSRSRAMCVTPPLFTAGFIDVGMSLDDGMTYPYLGGITVTHDILSLVHVSDWNSTPGSIMNVTWAPEALRGVDTVSIAVFEYSEDIETGNVSWHVIRTIATGVPNNATPYEFSLDPSSVRKSAIVGAVGIVENSTSPFPRLLRRSIWSKIHPLNWLSPVNQDLWCQEWASEQQAAPFFLEGRPPCPCAERQARRDTGAFTTSLDCRGQHANSAMCTMQRHTTFCVTTNTPSSQGAGQECCYDYGGNLVDIDTVGVGISIRSHIRGVFPFWSTGRVPFLSHYIADVMPFLQCCGSSDEVLSGQRGPCRLFHSVRPAQTCYDYVAPNKIASAFGDPHYKTFDGLNYTFNGFGEFTLVNGSHGEFVLQARSVPVKGSQRGTIFTAMAMTARDSDVIHVEVNPRRSLDVYFRRAGRKFEMLDFHVLNEWRLKGVTVRASDDLSTEGLLVVFDSSGISLEFSAFEGSLAVIVKLPAHFRGTTQGLLGTSNDDTSDDLQTPDGTTLPLSSSLEKIFSEFGQTWEVLPGMSLFFYRTGFNQSAFTSQSYQPAFTVNDVQLEDNNASSLCGQDAMCRFDLQATGSELFARHTLTLVGRFKHIQEDLAPVTCGELTSNPANGQVIVRGNSPGDVAYFTCDECFELRGSQAIRCHASGRWSALPPSCEPIGDRCPEPHVPANGNITLVRTCLETQVVFSCYEGFRLMGSSTISCLANGQWSAPCPKCHLDKPSPDQVVKQAERQLTAIESASIAAGVGVLLLALALAAACVVTRNRHVKEKEERKKRKSGVWTTIQNPTYNAKDKWSC